MDSTLEDREDSIEENSDSKEDRMDSMAGVRSEGVMEVNFGREADWRRGLEATEVAVEVVLIFREVRMEAVVEGVEKAREREGRVRSVASAREIIFIVG
jgi:hypothetical protein